MQRPNSWAQVNLFLEGSQAKPNIQTSDSDRGSSEALVWKSLELFPYLLCCSSPPLPKNEIKGEANDLLEIP